MGDTTKSASDEKFNSALIEEWYVWRYGIELATHDNNMLGYTNGKKLGTRLIYLE